MPFFKPIGITSHDAVAQIRKTIMQRRVGHTGTLDPQAEGLMLICLGKGTKLSQFLTDMEKTYEASIRFGQTSRTFDSEGLDASQVPCDPPDLTEVALEELLDKFRGRITQTVPAYSAVRVGGRRLYEMAREGQEVELPEREVEVKKLDLLSYEKPVLRVRVVCSKGTYIRSLANDLGQELQCGGYLARLRRTAVGKFTLEEALDIEQVDAYHKTDCLGKRLLSYGQALQIKTVEVSEEFTKTIVSGPDLTPAEVVSVDDNFDSGERIGLRSHNGDIIAIGLAEADSEEMLSGDDRKKKVFSYLRVLN